MDYMKGYDRRNRKRRSMRRIRYLKNTVVRKSRRQIRNSHMALRKLGSKVWLGGAIAAAVVVVVAIVIFAINNGAVNPSGVSGGAAQVADGGTPTPVPTATPVPTPRPKAVALTFDDGPRAESNRTPKVLALLKKYNAHATFFVLGTQARDNPQILKQQIAQGCEIGNHSWNHKNLSKLSMKKVKQQCNKTKKVVKTLTGYDVKLVRPPYGAISKKMRRHMNSPFILWNVDTEDWVSLDPEKILKRAKKKVKDGSIILMHDIYSSTATALETLLPWLIENGYDILTVSELAQRKGAKLTNGVAYGGFGLE